MIESSRSECLQGSPRLFWDGAGCSNPLEPACMNDRILSALRMPFCGGNSVTYDTKLQSSQKGSARWSVLIFCALLSFSWGAHADSSLDATVDKGVHSAAEAQEERFPYLAARTYDPTRWAGEEFHFSISMMGGEAARAVLNIGRVTEDENLGRVVPVQGLVGSVGLLSALLNFKYGGLTYLNAETGKPIWGEKLLEDGGRSRTYTTFYDRESYRAEVTRTENDRHRTSERMIPSHVDDVFSWILRLRNTDLAVGDTYTFYIFDGWLTRRLRIRVVSHVERYEDASQRKVVRAAEIDVTGDLITELFPLPWAEDAADLSPVFTVRKSEPLATTWITLDERRIPLGIELRTPLGF